MAYANPEQAVRQSPTDLGLLRATVTDVISAGAAQACKVYGNPSAWT